MPHNNYPSSSASKVSDSIELSSYFWGEFCVYTSIQDEYGAKALAELSEFIAQNQEGFKATGTDMMIHTENDCVVVTICTNSGRPEARDAIDYLARALQTRFLCSMRAYFMPDNIEEVWGRNFEVPIAPVEGPETSMGRRRYVQELLCEKHRLTKQIEKHQSTIGKIDELVEGVPENDEREEEVLLYGLMKEDLETQIDVMGVQIGELENLFRISTNINGIIGTTRQRPVPRAKTAFPLPVAGSEAELAWKPAKQPEKVQPSICSTVRDIVDHPIMKSAVSLVATKAEESYEIELLHILEDPKKVDELILTAKKMLRRIDKNHDVTVDQIARGAKGLLLLMRYVQANPNEKLFPEILDTRLRETDFSGRETGSTELSNLIFSIRQGLDKKKILNARRLLDGMKIDISRAKSIKQTGMKSVYAAAMPDGTSICFKYNEKQEAIPFIYNGVEVLGVEKIDGWSTFRLDLADGSSACCNKDMKPEYLDDDDRSTEIVDGFSCEGSSKVFFKTVQGSWRTRGSLGSVWATVADEMAIGKILGDDGMGTYLDWDSIYTRISLVSCRKRVAKDISLYDGGKIGERIKAEAERSSYRGGVRIQADQQKRQITISCGGRVICRLNEDLEMI